MNLLDRYLFREFCRTLLLVLLAFVAVYLLVDFFERIDEFIQADKPISLAGRFFLLKIPFIIEQLLPIGLLLSGVLTIGLLNHHGEMIALKSAGLCVGRIITPIMIIALLATGGTLAMGQWLLPPTVTATNRILYEEVRGRVPKGVLRNGRYFYRGAEGIYSFNRPDPGRNEYRNFTYTVWNKDHRLTTLLTAATAVWQDDRWEFGAAQVKKAMPDVGFRVTTHASLSLALPDTPADFFIPDYRVNEKSFLQLFREAQSVRTNGHGDAAMKLYERLSYIFLGLPLLLLGLPVLLLVHQRWGRDLSMAIPVSCSLAFVAWGSWASMQALARGNHLHPLTAAITVHLLVGGLGLYLIRQQDK